MRGPHLIRPGWARWLLMSAGVASAYYLSARLGLLLAFQATNASPVWPPSGLALGAVLLLGGTALPGIWLGSCLANAAVFTANHAAAPAVIWLASALIALGNMLEAWAGWWLLRRMVKAASPFEEAPDVFRFVATAFLMCLVSAGIGPLVLVLNGIIPWALYRTV